MTRHPMAEIEHALEAGEFVPYYQPIVDIRTGRLRGAEVLVRWRKPDGTLVLPGAFIPLMESSGLIHTLTRNLMQKVRDEAGPSIGRRSPPFRVSACASPSMMSARATAGSPTCSSSV
jgi:sensor c-di-GMP phosphodiesterase-like protein